MRHWTVLAVLCASIVFAGCPSEDSCNILTGGIYVAFDAVEKDGVATVTATFTVGGPFGTALNLGACGDDIAVNGVPLQEKRGAFVYYEAALAPADLYTFEFTRDGEGPYVSEVIAPPPVTIAAPAEATVVSRATAFDIAWEDNYEASPGIWLFIGGPCVEGISRDIGDNGLYTINAEDLELPDVADSCDVTISLTRTTAGTMDPAIEGTIFARSVDETWIASTP
jgi:hypothetical protein